MPGVYVLRAQSIHSHRALITFPSRRPSPNIKRTAVPIPGACLMDSSTAVNYARAEASGRIERGRFCTLNMDTCHGIAASMPRLTAHMVRA